MRDWFAGGVATGVGSLPGLSPDEWARVVAGEFPLLPHLVELPARGVGADLIGRTLGLLSDIYAEVVPSGWRIARRPGSETRRGKDFWSWDLDAAEAAFGGAEWVKVAVCGPWTLAAGVELVNGNRALTDSGAVDDIAASLLDGLRGQLDELRRRLPGTQFVVQVDEPGLPAVLRGELPTASGFGTVGPVDVARAREVLRSMTDGLAGLPLVAHCCHPQVPVQLLRDSGFGGLSIDVTLLDATAARLDPIGEALESGTILLAGLLPSAPPAHRRALRDWAAPLLTAWDRLGLNRSELAGVVTTPCCGLAGAEPAWARTALSTCAELARALQDLPEGW